MTWNCTIFSETSETARNPRTVGEEFTLNCQGEATELQKENLSIVAGTEAPGKYKLILLNTEDLRADGGRFVVTSYVVGAHKAEGIVLTDGQNFVPLQGFDWDIKTVIEQEPGKPPEPYGPMGPWQLQIPTWYWLILAVALAMAGYWGFRFYRKRRQRKELLAELSKHRTARLPFDEFHHDLRRFDRKWTLVNEPGPEFAVELNQIFRMYLVREFRVPALAWSTREILGEMRKFHREIFEVCSAELSRTLRELDRAISLRAAAGALDREQWVELCRTCSEKLWQQKSQKRENK